MDDWTTYAAIVLATAVVTLLLDPLRQWPKVIVPLINWLCHSYRIRVDTFANPSEGEIVVAVRNRSREQINLRDVRLMFAIGYGVSPLDAALPTNLPPGDANLSVGFEVSVLLESIRDLSVLRATDRQTVKLRPRAIDSKGRVYLGRSLLLSMTDGTFRKESVAYGVFRVVFYLLPPLITLGVILQPWWSLTS